jgi:hypothetical protein
MTQRRTSVCSGHYLATEGEVVASPASGPPARYTFKLSGSEEMYFKFSAGARFRSLARTLAARVSEAFRQAGAQG